MDASKKQQLMKYEKSKYRWKNIANTALDRLRKSAVLVALFRRDDDVHVWLTKRSMKMSREKGCVSFPGGMKEDGDVNEVDTCIRETCEEIGLERSQVDVVAVLPPHVAMGKILVTPVVGFVSPDFRPKPNEEVTEVFSVPLKRFLSELGHDTILMEVNNMTMYIHFFQDVVRDNTLVTSGLTAHVCIEVAMAYLQRPPSFDYSITLNASVANPFALTEHSVDPYISKL